MFKLNDKTVMYINLFVAVVCIIDLIINIIAGNVFFIITMLILIPMTLYAAYDAYKSITKKQEL